MEPIVADSWQELKQSIIGRRNVKIYITSKLHNEFQKLKKLYKEDYYSLFEDAKKKKNNTNFKILGG